MSRIVQAELLDSLPHDHPAARQNRRDLRLTNWIMGNHRWLIRSVPRHIRPGERLLELGAGDGELARRLQRRGRLVDALDLCPAPTTWPAAADWHRVNLRVFDGYGAYDAVYGNLIFHQFGAAELGALGAKLQSGVRVLLACEPARRRLSQWLFRLVAPWLGANYVSLHDARVSIAAGFAGDELPHLLGLAPAEWAWSRRATILGAYHLVAWRRTGRSKDA